MIRKFLSQLLPFLILLALWQLLILIKLFPPALFPSPQQVVIALVEEFNAGRLIRDIIASMYRVLTGFILSSFLGVFLGLAVARSHFLEQASLPIINFLRNLSAVAWIPFAIIWFGIGDTPVIFLVFMGALFPTILSTISAVKSVPKVYAYVANDYGIKGSDLLFKITLPAIAPQILTTLRMVLGLSWVIMVAAEMIAGQEGLGFAIFDARNGMRTDMLIAQMWVIGFIGIIGDSFMQKLQTLPSVRWTHER